MRFAARQGFPVRDHRWVDLDSVSPIGACAVVMGEDEQYFVQGTLNWPAQKEMVKRVLRGDFSRGGSGIAQQLARNLFLTPERNPRRKVREYALAWTLSHELSKKRQLELYLNAVEWGRGIWGIDAASRHYFGVAPSQLTATQGIILVSILPAPRRGTSFAVAASVGKRQEAVALKLWRARFLSDAALAETIDRLKEWRSRAARGVAPDAAWREVEALMGPDLHVGETLDGTRSPLNLRCDVTRRGA